MHTVQVREGERASFDSSNLSKRTSFDLDGEAYAQSRKRRSLDTDRAGALAGFVPPIGTPWAPFQMPMNPMMGMMGMPYCFPPPFVPPFLMPAAMAMWQQAVHQASATMRGSDLASPSPAVPPRSCGSAKSVLHCPSLPTVPETSSSDPESSDTEAAELPAEDFVSFIDKFLGDEEESSKELGLSASFGACLNLLGGSMTELSECCQPLDLQFSREDSHLDLLGLDLDLKDKSTFGLEAL